jgi:hypothetical protein
MYYQSTSVDSFDDGPWLTEEIMQLEEVATSKHCPPHHPHAFEPLFIEFNGVP